MSNCARCTNCGSDDVECTGTTQYNLDEYYCHGCETYFEIDWDKQDEIDKEEFEDELEDDEDEDRWENEGGSY